MGVRSTQTETRIPLMGRLLHLLAYPAHGRATLLLLGQDGHHGLGEEVGVLPVTHHLLHNTHTHTDTHYSFTEELRLGSFTR